MDGLTQYLAMENGAVTRQMDLLVQEKALIQRRLQQQLWMTAAMTNVNAQTNEELENVVNRLFQVEDVMVNQEAMLHNLQELNYGLRMAMEEKKREKRVMVSEINELHEWKNKAIKRMKKMEEQLLDKE